MIECKLQKGGKCTCQTECVKKIWYNKGKADVVDELKPFVHCNYKGKKFLFVCAEDFNNLSFAEQMKGAEE